MNFSTHFVFTNEVAYVIINIITIFDDDIVNTFYVTFITDTVNRSELLLVVL